MSKETRPFVERIGFERRSARLDRLRAVTPRCLLLAAVAITSLLGLRELFAPADEPKPTPGGVISDNAAYDFAQRFARAYLAYDPRRPALRERVLSRLVPEDFDLGTPASRGAAQRVLWTEIASDQEAIAGGRIVVVAAGVSTQPEPLYLGVPVDRVDGALVLTAHPSLTGAPLHSRAALPDRVALDDPQLLAVARRALTNYLAGQNQNLAADLARDAAVSIPDSRLRVLAIDDAVWARGEGSSAVLLTVVASDQRGARWTLSYELGVADERGRSVITFVETVPTDP